MINQYNYASNAFLSYSFREDILELSIITIDYDSLKFIRVNLKPLAFRF
jgi:hypothetical protein